MANDFHIVRVHSQLDGAPFHVQLEVQRDDATGVDPSPRLAAPGQYVVPLVQPDDDLRHIALGRFLDQWNKLELSLRLLLMQVTNSPMEVATVMANSLGARGLIETLLALAPSRIPVSEQSNLTELLVRLKGNNTKRNYIVHGYWTLHVVLMNWGGKPGIKYHQFREYPPSSAEEQKQMGNPANRSLREKYMFSVPRINSIAREVARLGADFDAFTGRCFRNSQNVTQ